MGSKTLKLIVFLLSFSFAITSLSYALDYRELESVDSSIQLRAGFQLQNSHDLYKLNSSESIERRFSFNDIESIPDYTLRKSMNNARPIGRTHQDILSPLTGDISFYLADGASSKQMKADLALPASMTDVAQAGIAFLTNLVVHEFGHTIVADYAGARGNKLDFFNKEGLTFEHALREYRKNPTMYNKSLLLFSGTDFLWYCFYAFYLSEEHPHFDPVTIAKETGLSKDSLFSIVLAKTALNAYRIYNGEDKVIPYFTVDKYSASLNLLIPFENLWLENSPLFN